MSDLLKINRNGQILGIEGMYFNTINQIESTDR
jgi:hypothetical protein